MTRPTPTLAARAAHILRMLRRGRPVTVPALADALEVSEPTVRRTIHWLRDAMFAPIEFDRSRNTWVLTDRTWSLPLDMLSKPDQVFAMAWAVRLAMPAADLELREQIDELFEVLALRLQMNVADLERALDAVTVEHTEMPSFEGAPTRVALECIAHRRPMEMDYDSPWKASRGKPRHILPLHVRYVDGQGYLLAREIASHAHKVFALARVRNARRIPTPWPIASDRADRAAIERWCSSFGVWLDDEVLPVTVWVAPSHAEYVRRQCWQPSCRDRIEPDGTLVRKLTAARSPDLVNRLLSLGDGLVWVEPAEVRADVARVAQNLAQRLTRAPRRQAGLRKRPSTAHHSAPQRSAPLPSIRNPVDAPRPEE